MKKMSNVNPFNGFRPMQEQFRAQLPVGGYIAVIQDARAENRADGNQMLVFTVEITEGPYAGFFLKDYRAQEGSQYPARYRGVYRIFCPTNNLQQEDLWMLDRFNLTMGAIMASNPGFNWNWNTDSLKGMTVGISVRENEYNGCIFRLFHPRQDRFRIRSSKRLLLLSLQALFLPCRKRYRQLLQSSHPQCTHLKHLCFRRTIPMIRILPSDPIPYPQGRRSACSGGLIGR